MGKQWTDSGEVHEERGLKGRAKDDTRVVPCRPALTRILRNHIEGEGLKLWDLSPNLMLSWLLVLGLGVPGVFPATGPGTLLLLPAPVEPPRTHRWSRVVVGALVVVGRRRFASEEQSV